MIKLDDLNEEEIEVLEDKFNNFSIEFKSMILDSGLFRDESEDEDFYEFVSHSYDEEFDNRGQRWGSGMKIYFDNYSWRSLRILLNQKVVEKPEGGFWFFGVDFSRRMDIEITYTPVFIKGKMEPFLSYRSKKGINYNQLSSRLDDDEINLSNEELDFIKKINNKIFELIEISKIESKQNTIDHSKNIVTSISELDKDNNGEVDLIDGEGFNKLLNKHQKSITEIDKNYIQKFVKISMYLKTKKKNTQQIFESISETRNEKELDELMSLLKNQIHTYELLVFHSLSMITSLVENDLITFYEIYESFDQVGVFNSNWENEVSNKLSDIGDGIRDLMYSINTMEYNIINSLDNLTYSTQESFGELNKSISSQLSSIDSSININNLLTGIQTYQVYKVNQNTKRIN